MKCDRCDNEATVHLTQVINGKMKKLHLCGSCSSEMGVGQGGFSVSDVLLGKGPGQPLAGVAGNRACQTCGWTLRKLRKVGRLGCPDCYQAFDKEILGLLRSIHHATEHTGRSPKIRGSRVALATQLEDLRSRISEAVAEEAYEQAAAFRDELAKLEATLGKQEEA
jgi:protein arginine kinase activator